MNFKHYKNAAYPCIAVETCEEGRLIASLKDQFKKCEVLSIAAVGGLKNESTGQVIDARAAYPQGWSYAIEHPGSILVTLDLHHILKNSGVYRALKQSLPSLKAINPSSMCVLCAPSWQLPDELKHDIPVVQFELPTRAELGMALDVVAKGAGVVAESPELLLDAAAGLSLSEAENAFALALVEKKKLDPTTVEREKMRLVKSSGYLEVSMPESPDAVGGLQGLKDYINESVIPSCHDEELRVKGILLVGVQGCGKSLASKALGAMMHWPIVRMDFSKLKGSLVGQSENNLSQALKLADAIAPCVLWIDEIEKGIGGHASSAQTDGGTTLGMLGMLLTWLEEHKSPVITIATCNDYSKLPPELTRTGRFDERFFVDLPSYTERVEIARVHLIKYVQSPNGLCEIIAKLSEGFSGAEIKGLVLESARQTRRQVTEQSIRSCAAEIKPLSKVKADEIRALRTWAKDTLRLANTGGVAVAVGSRSVDSEGV